MRDVQRLLPWLVLCGCAGHYSGTLSMERAERGEIFLDVVGVGEGRQLVRAVAIIDAPPWRVMNLFSDFSGFPLWNTAIASVTETKADGDYHELQVEFRPGMVSMPTMVQRIQLDPERHQVSMLAYENEKVKSQQSTIKLETLGGGERTLLHMYSKMEMKFAIPASELIVKEIAVKTIGNLRDVVKLPRYGERREIAAGKKRLKLMMPPLRGKQDDAQLMRAVGRLMAEKLMREGAWNVVTEDEIVAMLNYAGKQQLAGCSGWQCYSQASSMLAAEYILDAEVTHAGTTLVMSASLVRVKDGAVVARASADGPDEAALFERAKTAATELAVGKIVPANVSEDPSAHPLSTPR